MSARPFSWVIPRGCIEMLGLEALFVVASSNPQDTEKCFPETDRERDI